MYTGNNVDPASKQSMGVSTMSTSVHKDKVARAIARLPESLRRRVNAIYHSSKSFRHGSPQYGTKHPGAAVTDDQRKLMAICHYKAGKYGMPFRPMEPAFKLYPASGNDAQRCADAGLALLRKDGMPDWFKTVEKEVEAMKEAEVKAKAAAKLAKLAKRKKQLAAA